MPTIELTEIPNVENIQRVLDEWFDSRPLTTAYAALAGFQEGADETDGEFELPLDEQERIKASAVKYFWLSAIRKRLSRAD